MSKWTAGKSHQKARQIHEGYAPANPKPYEYTFYAGLTRFGPFKPGHEINWRVETKDGLVYILNLTIEEILSEESIQVSVSTGKNKTRLVLSLGIESPILLRIFVDGVPSVSTWIYLPIVTLIEPNQSRVYLKKGYSET